MITKLFQAARATLRTAWKATPDDAARLLLAALAMPLIYMLPYHLMPTQTLARVAFNVCVGALGLYVGLAIQTRRNSNGCPIDNAGYIVGACSLASMAAAMGALVVLDEPTMTWRTVTAGSQGAVALGWLVLWRISDRWLSRSFSRWSFLAAAAGFALYVLANFGLPDPVMGAPWTWGWTQPKGIVARTLALPLEPMLGIALVTMIVLAWRRYVLRHGPRRRPRSP